MKYQNYNSFLYQTLASIDSLQGESSSADSTIWHDAME